MVKEDTYESNMKSSPGDEAGNDDAEDDADEPLDEIEDEDGKKIVPTMPADAAGAKKVSYGSYGEFTIIDGIMYNNRGYEICGVLNQHNRPCQRIGKCPFHYKLKEKQAAEKKKKEAAQASSTTNAASSDAFANQQKNADGTLTEATTGSAAGTASGGSNIKKPPPMKKTPYKQGWTKEEHFRFLTGLQIHGKGAWKDIAIIVGSRTPTQIQSHAQKYFLRQKQKVKNKRSIHDFTLDDLRKALNVANGGAGEHGSTSSSSAEDENSPGDAGSSSPKSQDEEIAPPPPRKEKKKKPSKKEQAAAASASSAEQVSQQQQQYQQVQAHQQQQQDAGVNNHQNNGDLSKNFAAIMSAMQNNAQTSGNNNGNQTGLNIAPALAASYLGSLLMNNPTLLQAVQQQQAQKHAQQQQQQQQDTYQQSTMQNTYTVAPVMDMGSSYNSYLQNPFDYDQSPFDASKHISRMQAQQVPEPVFDYNATQLSSFDNPTLGDILGNNNAFDPLSSPTIPGGYSNSMLASVNVPNTALQLSLPTNPNLKRKLNQLDASFEDPVNPIKKRTISWEYIKWVKRCVTICVKIFSRPQYRIVSIPLFAWGNKDKRH